MYTDSRHVAKRGGRVGQLKESKWLGVIWAKPARVADEARDAQEEQGGQQLREAMQAVAGFARRLLARRMNLRHTPELRFVLDDSIAAGSETLALIRSLEIEPESEPESEEASAPRNQEGGEDGEKESTQ